MFWMFWIMCYVFLCIKTCKKHLKHTLNVNLKQFKNDNTTLQKITNHPCSTPPTRQGPIDASRDLSASRRVCRLDENCFFDFVFWKIINQKKVFKTSCKHLKHLNQKFQILFLMLKRNVKQKLFLHQIEFLFNQISKNILKMKKQHICIPQAFAMSTFLSSFILRSNLYILKKNNFCFECFFEWTETEKKNETNLQKLKKRTKCAAIFFFQFCGNHDFFFNEAKLFFCWKLKIIVFCVFQWIITVFVVKFN